MNPLYSAVVIPSPSLILDPLRRLAGAILNLLFPPACAACARPGESPGLLCDECDGKLIELVSAPSCVKCAVPLAQSGDPCPWCLGRGVHPFAAIARLGVYHAPLRELIHRMKYAGQWFLAESLADRLFERPSVCGILAGCDCVVPVPLHFWRQFRRGYNQSEILARRLAKRSHLEFAHALARIRPTQTQTDLHSREARVANVRDAFALDRPDAVRGKHIVLIDDVQTTGATLQAAARALLPAKPASIAAIVVAVADPRGRDFSSI